MNLDITFQAILVQVTLSTGWIDGWLGGLLDKLIDG